MSKLTPKARDHVKNALIIENVHVEPRIILHAGCQPSLIGGGSPRKSLGTALAEASHVACILNLGISAWTAWKINRLDKKVDVIGEELGNVNTRLDRIDVLIGASVTHLDKLISNNAAMLGYLLDGQNELSSCLVRLRSEFSSRLDAILDRINSTEAKREAQKLEQQMRTLLSYYEICSGELQAGRLAPSADLRRIIDVGTEIRTWLDTRLAAFVQGSAERLPYFKSSALALCLEIEARCIADEAAAQASRSIASLRSRIAEELQALTESATLYQLAVARRALIEQYIFLTRALRTQAIVSFDDQADKIIFEFPEGVLSWDDGLDKVRATLLDVGPTLGDGPFELVRLADHRAWRSLKKLPRGISTEIINRDELIQALGLPPGHAVTDENLRVLLRLAPAALSDIHSRIKQEAF
jgi:hypothetical protein